MMASMCSTLQWITIVRYLCGMVSLDKNNVHLRGGLVHVRETMTTGPDTFIVLGPVAVTKNVLSGMEENTKLYTFRDTFVILMLIEPRYVPKPVRMLMLAPVGHGPVISKAAAGRQ